MAGETETVWGGVDPSRHAAWRWPVLVLVAALLTRVLWAAVVPVAPYSDAFAYDAFARNLARGQCYGWNEQTPTAFWAVGTSFMYSLCYRVTGPESGYGLVLALNIAIGVATVLLAMVLAGRWFGRAAGLTSGAVLALWPMHVQFTTVIASEQVFTMLCLAGVLAWPTGRVRLQVGRLVVASVIFAAATYVRPTALLLPGLLAGAAIVREGWGSWDSWKWNVPRAAVAGAIILALLSPWSMRNQRVFGEFVLVSTNSGSNLWMGNNPETTGHYMPLPPRPAHMNEATFDKQLGQEAKAYILREPLTFVQRTFTKAVLLHDRETIGIAWNQEGLRQVMGERQMLLLKVASQAYWLVVMMGGLAGAGMMLSRHGRLALFHPALLVWGYFTAVHAVIVIQDRYHYPATPMIASLAAMALVAAWPRLMRDRLPELDADGGAS
jgi:4-amino-4-deoxy-L-arabinose transferase-like glycosyltransferase